MEHSKIIQRAKHLRDEGLSYRKIARQMNTEGFKNVSGRSLTDNSVYYYANYPDKNSSVRENTSRPTHSISSLVERIWEAEIKLETKRKIVDLIFDEIMG